jgi:PKD repeat protein
MSFYGWTWKQTHIITAGSALTDYQVKFTVYKGTGTSSGESVYCNNHCNDDFSDIRFSTDGENALPYWIESYTSGVSAIIWVKVPSITTTTILIYYGNVDATSESDGDATFVFFDDFPDSTLNETKWPGTVGSITKTITSSELRITDCTRSGTTYWIGDDTKTGNQLISNLSINNLSDYEIIFKQKITDNASNQVGQLGIGITNSSDLVKTYIYHNNGHGSAIDLSHTCRYNSTTITPVSVSGTDTCIFGLKKIGDNYTSQYKENPEDEWTTHASFTNSSPVSKMAICVGGIDGYPYFSLGTIYYIYIVNTSATFEHSTWGYESLVEPPETLTFDFSPDDSPQGTTVTFLACFGFNFYCFDFGDGEISYLNPATHIYQEPGEYTVTATACGSTGDPIYTATDTVVVTGDCGFYAKPVRGKIPLTVQFIDESDFADAWSWDFGDGSTSSDQHPVHTYQHAETYTVRLTITKGTKQTTFIKETYIGATESDPPVAGFTMSVREGNAPLSVTFTDASTGTITSSTWDFGDGSTSTETNPTHIYSVPGFYFVTRRVLNAEWESECIGSVHVEDPLYVSFSAIPLTGYAPLPIRFRPIIEGIYERISWDFGDDTTSTDWHPTHTYTVPGTYTVTLSVYQHSAFPVTTTKTLTIKDPAVLPAADFTADIQTGLSPLTVAFTDTSTGTPTSRLWTFGDGTTSTATNPTHTYTAPGTYTVSLKVTNAYGYDTETKTGYITVVAAPVAAMDVDCEIGYISHEFAFTDESLYNPTSWEWTVDGTIVSTDQDLNHTFSSVGSHWVSLTVTNDYGTDTIGKDITIVPAGYPIASFTYALSSRVLPITVTCTDTSQGTPASWLWDFGDGFNSTLQNPVHSYYHSGEYVVSLTVTNSTGTMTTQMRIA